MRNSTRGVVSCYVNGELRATEVDARSLLVELVRDGFGLKGTHIGCLTGDCGACTLLLDGKSVKSCTVLAVASQGCHLTTVEGLGTPGALHPIQQSFWDAYGFQCGYCLPGMLMCAYELLGRNPHPTADEIRLAIDGNICRCTGYENVVRAIALASERIAVGEQGHG